MFVKVNQPTVENAENRGTLMGNEARSVGRCWVTYVNADITINGHRSRNRTSYFPLLFIVFLCVLRALCGELLGLFFIRYQNNF